LSRLATATRKQAPRIELDADSFVRIPDLSKLDAYNKKQQKKGLKGDSGGYATIAPGDQLVGS
jgi:hypothetical protein